MGQEPSQLLDLGITRHPVAAQRNGYVVSASSNSAATANMLAASRFAEAERERDKNGARIAPALRY